MSALNNIFYLWITLNYISIILMIISKNRLDYLIEFAAYFYSKNILDFILKAVILFAYLPFNIASLIKEIFNK